MIHALPAPITILPVEPPTMPDGGCFPGPQTFLANIREARSNVQSAHDNLDNPPGVVHVVDPAIPAQAHAQRALGNLDVASIAQGVPTAARTAANNAREDVLAGYNSLRYRLNGPLPVARVLEQFDSATNWLNIAESIADPRVVYPPVDHEHGRSFQLPHPDSPVQ